MSMLSDATLLSEIANGRLIVNGESRHVSHCAYRCTAAKIFEPGPSGAIHDWSNPGADAHYSIDPGAIVWLRTAGIVEMPSDRCAFYWQTNTLSRQGLMLVNSSMVEPGYKGPLACLFANFGRQAIVINPETVVAKLVFFCLDHAAVRPRDLTYTVTEYDRTLKQVASLGAPSFLQISDLSRRVDQDAQAAIRNIKTETDDAISIVTKAAETIALGQTRNLELEHDKQIKALRDERDKQLRALTEDFDKRIRSVLLTVVVGLTVVFALMNLVPYVQRRVRPNIEQEVQDRVAIQVQRVVASDLARDATRRDSTDAALTAAISALRRSVDATQANVVRLAKRVR